AAVEAPDGTVNVAKDGLHGGRLSWTHQSSCRCLRPEKRQYMDSAVRSWDRTSGHEREAYGPRLVRWVSDAQSVHVSGGPRTQCSLHGSTGGTSAARSGHVPQGDA